MKKVIIIILTIATAYACQNKNQVYTSGGWIKYTGNPVLGGNLGTIFDVSVLKLNDTTFKMYSSWRPKKSVALSESKDGLTWSEPVICLSYDDSSTWEKDINRPVVIQKGDSLYMWYTGQSIKDGSEYSCIGFATSKNGKEWKKISKEPVLYPTETWEKVSVMCPHVIWDEQESVFKMWYSGGEQYEPDAIGYAISSDGQHWTRHSGNPIFSNNKKNTWEQAKVTACQVIKRENDYLMFYIGFTNIDYAQIGMAKSKDGINDWMRYDQNPIIKPGMGWDSSAVYKPYAVQDKNRWLLYYNGRRNNHEQIGIAIHEENQLGF